MALREYCARHDARRHQDAGPLVRERMSTHGPHCIYKETLTGNGLSKETFELAADSWRIARGGPNLINRLPKGWNPLPMEPRTARPTPSLEFTLPLNATFPPTITLRPELDHF